MNPAVHAVGALHGQLVHGRRIRTLAWHAHELLPECASLLDVGCGDGALDAVLKALRPSLSIVGTDVLHRPKTFIPVELFDGTRLPFADKQYDAVMLVDVLHHTSDPAILLTEACRVARKGILLKDHSARNNWDKRILRFMDWVGNSSHGVNLPYNYWSMKQWKKLWETLGLRPKEIRTDLNLYPAPASLIFEARLHFFTYLEISAAPGHLPPAPQH